VSFRIQASTPRVAGARDPEDETVCEAAETTFSLHSEQAYLNWNDVHVPLSYKHDVGTMSEDIVRMLRALRENQSGRLSIEWPTNTFASKWALEWDSEGVLVRGNWYSVVGETESMLNAKPEVKTSKEGFRAEWKALLMRLVEGLEHAGYTTRNLPELEDVRREIEALPDFGELYDE